MARVTVEDCLENVDNRFELVLVATKRARQISSGKEPMLEWENDKPTVMALREIAEGLVSASILDESEEEALEAEGGVEVTAEDIEEVPGLQLEQAQQPSSEETPAAEPNNEEQE